MTSHNAEGRFAKPPPAREHTDAALVALKYVLEAAQDAEILIDACWAVQFLSCGSAERITAVLKAGIGKLLITNVLTLQDPRLVLPAIQSIGAWCGGSETQTEHVVRLKALPALRGLLSHVDGDIVRDTCFALSNIASGTVSQVQTIIDGGVITSVVNVATSGDYRSRIEACYVLARCSSLSISQHPPSNQ
jgi:hypothetical protein